MEKDIICNIIRESQDVIPAIELYERPLKYEPNGNYVFVGVRQSGKSYMIHHLFDTMTFTQQLLNALVYHVRFSRLSHTYKDIIPVGFIF